MSEYDYFSEAGDPNLFACTCGCGTIGQDPGHIARLDAARGISGVPYRISRGISCIAHNRAKGGATDSEHLIGHGTDIKTKGSRDRYLILDGLRKAGFNRFGIYPSHIHVGDSKDHDPDVIWYGTY